MARAAGAEIDGVAELGLPARPETEALYGFWAGAGPGSISGVRVGDSNSEDSGGRQKGGGAQLGVQRWNCQRRAGGAQAVIGDSVAARAVTVRTVAASLRAEAARRGDERMLGPARRRG